MNNLAGYWLRCGVVLAAFSMLPAEAADELDMASDLSPFSLRLGVYDMNLSTKVRVDGVGGNLGSSLDFEDDLNLDDNKDTFDIAFRWRFKKRHFLEVEYFQLKRNGLRRLDGEIRFGDTVLPVGADVRSSFTTEVTRLSYAYRLVHDRDWGLAIGAGLHVTRLRAALTEIDFDNIQVPTGESEIAAVTAPLPVIGISGARRLGEKGALILRAQLFEVAVDDVDGRIEHAAIHFEHDTFERVGFGIGYDWFNIDIESRDRLWIGRADVKFHGPMLFLKGSF